jgi:hypothetical protein
MLCQASSAVKANTGATNFTNPYQGDFRTRKLDVNLLTFAAAVDDTYLQRLTCHRNPMRMHVTCCDHLEADDLLLIARYNIAYGNQTMMFRRPRSTEL